MKKLTKRQKQQIWIEFRVGGGYEELANKVVENISAIVEGRPPPIKKKGGRPKLSQEELLVTEEKLESAMKQNRHLKSDRSIHKALGIPRRRVATARKSICRRKRYELFRRLRLKHSPVKSPLSDDSEFEN